jgi:hypothetical protein
MERNDLHQFEGLRLHPVPPAAVSGHLEINDENDISLKKL